MTVRELDITRDHCPMTFVKTRLELEKLEPGDRLAVLLAEGEPLDNVPKSAAALGYRVVETLRVSGSTHRVIIERPAGAPAGTAEGQDAICQACRLPGDRT